MGFLLPRPSCVTLNQAESSSLRSVPALRFLIWGHLETCKGADEFGSSDGDGAPAGRWVGLIQVGRLTEKEGRSLALPITVASWANRVIAGASDSKSLLENCPGCLSLR